MLLIYVAGPFRGKTPWEVHCNVNRAEQLAYEVQQIPNCFPVVPHMNTKNFDGLNTAEFWINGTLELMERACDAVILVEGWERSQGTLGEIARAELRGMPVFERIDQLRKWAAYEHMR
jgi:hypothetical protein